MRQNDDFPVQDASVNANAIVNVDFLIYIVQVLSLTFPHGQAQFFSASSHIGNRAKLTRENLPNKYIDINQPKSLHDYLVLLVQRPEITRRDSALGLEDTVEVGQVVETAFVTYFRILLSAKTF